MDPPTSCTVLVIGGGPGGSFAAAALAREGIDVALVEAETFPRYHIGESMLASMRFFLRFIDLDKKFDSHGFNKKRGSAFKINEKKEGYTDFIAANGPGNHSWNVIRSEADDMIFRHAEECGAKVFDGTKISAVQFVPGTNTYNDMGRPVSATWSRKNGQTGNISFEYLIDASGRAGVVSTKYMKNRKFNQSLKNVATWSYWKGVKPYAAGTEREGSPLFEALDDGTGWVWNIPLHDGTMSVGVVMEQEVALRKRKAMDSPSDADFYRHCLGCVPMIKDLMAGAEMVAGCKSASNYSYSASAYASPNLRIVGDAGCFIDPYFSSGVHLALSSSLSAVATIQAARKGDCDEDTAAQWHNDKVKEGYTVFLLIVLATMKQIRSKLEPILSDWDEDGFDRAFKYYRPIIQGTAAVDFTGKLTQAELSSTVDFAMQCYNTVTPEEEVHAKALMDQINNPAPGRSMPILTEDDQRILKTIQARRMLQCEATINLNYFAKSSVNGMAPRLERGMLGLEHVAPEPEMKEDSGSVPRAPIGMEGDASVAVKEDIKVF